MLGFLNLFKNIGKAADAIAQKKSEKIEADNVVEFGKQDIETLQNDIRKVKGNIGSIKGEIAVLRDKINSMKADIKKHDDDALALSESHHDLAEQHANIAESIEDQVNSLESALKIQEDLLKEQMKTRSELENSLQQAQTDLVTIKAMSDAASANEKLANISSSSGSNALASFKQRQEDAKKRLIKSQALKEDSSTNTSLDQQTAAALGKTSSSRLERLKQQKK